MTDEFIDLRVYFDLLLRRRRIILLLTLLLAGLVYAYSQTLPSEYRAVTGLIVAPNRANLRLPGDLQLSAEDGQRIDLRYRNAALLEVARSIHIAQTVLLQEPDLVQALGTSNPARVARMVEISGKDDWIGIQAKASTPQLATRLARAWVHAAAERINRLYAVDAVIEVNLEAEAQNTWADYLQKQAALEAFLGENSIASLEAQIQSLETSLAWTAFDMKLVNALRQETQLQELLLDAEMLKQKLQRGSAEPDWGTVVAFINLQTQAFGGQLAGQVVPVSQSFTVQEAALGSLHFDLSGPPPTITVADVETLIGVLQNKLAMVQAQLTTLAESEGGVGDQGRTLSIEGLAQELTALRARLEQEQARQRQLTSARDAAWQSYLALTNKLQEVRVERAVAVQEVQVAFDPFPPAQRSAPKVLTNTAIGALAGLLLGVVWALGQAYLGQGLVINTRWSWLGWLLNASGLPHYPPAGAVPVEAVEDSTRLPRH